VVTTTGGSIERATMGSNMGPHMEVAKPAIFNGEAEKVGGFIMVCRLFLRMKLREATVEEQVQWVLLYAGRICRCMKEECNGGVKGRGNRI